MQETRIQLSSRVITSSSTEQNTRCRFGRRAEHQIELWKTL